VVAEALKVAEAVGVPLSTTEYDLGADRYVRTGEILPDEVLEELRTRMPSCSEPSAPRWVRMRCPRAPSSGASSSACASSSTSTSHAPVHRGARCAGTGLRLRGDPREHRGHVCRKGGFLRKGTPFEVATQGSVNTRHGVERCARFAFALAAERRGTG